MNAECLLQHYEQIADAPAAIARLRRFILDLAVRGKLVPQDPADEPASELWAQLRKAYISPTLEKGGRGRRSAIAAGLIETPLFELPANWVWTPMGGLGETNIGLTYSPADLAQEGYPVLRSNNIQQGKIDLSDLVRVRPRPKDSVLVQVGDMLICARNGSRSLVGKAALLEEVTEPMAFGAFMAIFRSPINRYLHLFVSSPAFRNAIDEVNTNTINQLTQGNLKSTLVPLPPLAEQHRIIAKVDELMALCDELQAARKEREAKRDRLAAASYARLNAPDPETFRDDARFALDALPALTARPDQIKQLRQTILNLAVRGKLVPQDPQDEPTAELLTRIVELPWTKKRKSSELELDDSALTSAFDLPTNWAWASVNAIVRPNELVTYGILKPEWVSDGVPTVRVTEMRTGVIDLANLPRCHPLRAAKFEKTKLSAGDLLVSKDGTIGKTAFVPPELEGGNITQHVLRFPICELVNRYYIRLTIDSPFCQAWMVGETKGVALQGVNVGDFRRMPIPLPPLAEQHRIVAKVDELMALCDQLETSLTSADDTRKKLLDALLAEALSPVDAEALQEAAE